MISRLESKLRPIMTKIPNELFVSFYSNQKKKFLQNFAADYSKFDLEIENYPPLKIWDLEFSFPLFNSAGMFKKAEAYYTVAKQGAGAWLAGTSTGLKRQGNFRNGVLHPFSAFPRSGSSLNWMGLPNESHEVLAKRISRLEKQKGTPIGVSLSTDSVVSEKKALELLVDGLKTYEKAGVDFFEINESCPNVQEGHEIINDRLDESLIKRLEFISENFIKVKDKRSPLIVKLSLDTDIDLIDPMVKILIDLGFDGINLGNTSTNYSEIEKQININERNLFNHFIKTFGGGASGRPLKNKSLNLASKAVQASNNTSSEFKIIRTGGIENVEDLKSSLNNGIELNQWYTGYFSAFSIYGHKLYNHFKKQMIS